MKGFLILLFVLLGQTLFSQDIKVTDDDSTYPVYRGCAKKSTNGELEACSK
ncbi:MAG: hypothetical protein V7719_02865 [Psychroserpens sp.]|uniref:hypothetical protein n=1 Tax=Psychroserpens sp. TaxID=2020870 RepID=UPI0030028960